MLGPSTRLEPRDGACLLFDRDVGTNVLVRGPSTRHLRSRAPRVVMFALTNACNLRCDFCSRSLATPSTWDEASAFELLAGLDRAGVLEVALGGGEPLVARGLDGLLARLHAETRLAVHLTTNAVLLDDARLARIRPYVGEIRVSIYDDNPWPERIAALAAAGGSFGANVLVVPERIDALGALLARLEDLGCPDVALLGYVGPDASRSLDARDLDRIGALARRTSMRVRTSVCSGRALGLPLLDTGELTDCGAGADFVVIGSDRTLRACSFAGHAIPFERAEDAIAIWQRERARLGNAVDLHGCARRARAEPEALADGVRVWRAFSGNNSGDCFLVGKFERAGEARRFVDDLREGYVAGKPFAESWVAHLRARGIDAEPGEHMPDHLSAIGRTVLAHTWFAPEDDFPSLRALVWRRNGREVATGVHEHEPVHLLTAMWLADASALEDVEVRGAVDDLGAFLRRGEVLFGIRQLDRCTLEDALALTRDVEAQGGVASAELAAGAPPPLAHALAARPPSEGAWLAVSLPSEESAARFARELRGSTRLGYLVLVRAARIPPRLGLRAAQLGSATVVEGDAVALSFAIWQPTHTPLDAERLDRELRAELGPAGRLDAPLSAAWRSVRGCITTSAPHEVGPRVAAFATSRGLTVGFGVRSPRPFHHALSRLEVDIRALRRERRT